MESTEALGKLIAEVEHGDLVFSTHAQVALQVRMALDDPEIHLAKVALLVQAEPMLAAKVVGLANSVAFNRSGNPISDVRAAVTRLGVNLIRGLSTALILRQFSEQPTPAHESLAARLWEHSTHTAALCYVLARRVSRQSPDMAMFAGIVHEIGSFYLISRAAAYPELLDNSDSNAWTLGGEARVGGAVLRALAVPEAIASAVKAQWEGDFKIPPTSLGDTLYLANLLTPIANPLQNVSAEMERNAMLALSTQVIADRTLASILEESGEELNTIVNSLSF